MRYAETYKYVCSLAGRNYRFTKFCVCLLLAAPPLVGFVKGASIILRGRSTLLPMPLLFAIVCVCLFVSFPACSRACVAEWCRAEESKSATLSKKHFVTSYDTLRNVCRYTRRRTVLSVLSAVAARGWAFSLPTTVLIACRKLCVARGMNVCGRWPCIHVMTHICISVVTLFCAAKTTSDVSATVTKKRHFKRTARRNQTGTFTRALYHLTCLIYVLDRENLACFISRRCPRPQLRRCSGNCSPVLFSGGHARCVLPAPVSCMFSV